MKALAAALVACVVGSAPVAARQLADRGFERITVEAPPTSRVVRWFEPVGPPQSRRLGVFSLVPPQKRGEIVRVSIPLPDLASRAYKGVAAANRRRHEKAARQRVEAELKQFEEQQVRSHP